MNGMYPAAPGAPGAQGMDPSMMQGLLMGGDDDPQMMQLKKQQAMADMLRKQSMQQPGMVDAGRAKIAPIGQIAGNVMAGMRANQMQPGLDAGMADAAKRSMDARAGYVDKMAMALRRNYPQSATPMLPPDGMEDQ